MDKDISQLDPVAYNEYAGDYKMSKKKRKMIYYEDQDNDLVDDNLERAAGVAHHRAKHISFGGGLFVKNGIIGFEHDTLKSFPKRKGMKLTMKSPKKMNMSIKTKKIKLTSNMDKFKMPSMRMEDKHIKNPDNINLNIKMKDIKMPRSSLDDTNIKSVGSSFIKQHKLEFLNKMLKKRKYK